MVRGGSYFNNRRNCRAAYRNRNEPANFNNNLDFRVVRSTLWLLAGSACCPRAATPRPKMAGRFPASRQRVANIESPGPLW